MACGVFHNLPLTRLSSLISSSLYFISITYLQFHSVLFSAKSIIQTSVVSAGMIFLLYLLKDFKSKHSCASAKFFLTTFERIILNKHHKLLGSHMQCSNVLLQSVSTASLGNFCLFGSVTYIFVILSQSIFVSPL